MRSQPAAAILRGVLVLAALAITTVSRAAPPTTAAPPTSANSATSTTQPAKSDLPTIARNVSHEFQPASDAQIAADRKAIQQVYGNMDQYLASQGAVAEGWRTFLLWPELKSQLELPGPPNPQMLLKIARRCESSESVFRSPVCREAKETLRRSARTMLLATTTFSDVERELAAMAAALEQPAEGSTANDRSEQIAAGLAWLEQRGVAPQLTAQVRRHYCQPNLWLAVSDDVIGSTIDTQVASNDDFNDTILGTTYTGRSFTRGDLRLRLVPDPQRINVQLAYQFTVASNATGFADRVQVQSQATTAIGGEKRLTIDPSGVTLHPATASASTNSQINDISSGRRFGRRATERGVYEGKGATEQEVARRAEEQIKGQLDRQAAEAIDPALKQLRAQLWNPLVAGGAVPRDIRCRTTETFAYLSLAQAGEGELAAHSRPRWLNTKADMMLYVHQSLLDNLAAATLAGKTWREANWEHEWQQIFGSVPAGLQVADRENPWSVTFSRPRPMSIRFDRGALELTVRAEKFSVGETNYPGMSVTARYEREANGSAWRRAERLEIASLGNPDEKTGARQQVFRTMLRKRFDPIFPAEFVWETIDVPSSASKPRKLRIDQIQAEDGWLAVLGILDSAPAPSVQSGR